MKKVRTRLLGLVAVLVTGLGCVLIANPATASVTAGATVVGRPNAYDYSPSVIDNNGLQKFWWCSEGDHIYYESIDTATGAKVGPKLVLDSTPGTFDSVHTCNPEVVQGVFVNPLNAAGPNPPTYSYAMYYVGVDNSGLNKIGLAFSSDGISWVKDPSPAVSPPAGTTGYGYGEPAAYNSNGAANITLFIEYTVHEAQGSTPKVIGHFKTTSTDGVHFTGMTPLSQNGLGDSAGNGWGDMAYDSQTGYWYAAFHDGPNQGWRKTAASGGQFEKGQYGTTLFRLLNSQLASGTWQQLTTVDTNQSGYEANFIPGLLRDQFGNVNVGPYPKIELFLSTSTPRPAGDGSDAVFGASGFEGHWDIVWSVWNPGQPKRTLTLYQNPTNLAFEATTGYVDTAVFDKVSSLATLYEAPTATATKPLYGCKLQADYFVSTTGDCEGHLILGLEGYAYPSRTTATQVALYRCYNGVRHFVSLAADCGGSTVEALLGFGDPV